MAESAATLAANVCKVSSVPHVPNTLCQAYLCHELLLGCLHAPLSSKMVLSTGAMKLHLHMPFTHAVYLTACGDLRSSASCSIAIGVRSSAHPESPGAMSFLTLSPTSGRQACFTSEHAAQARRTLGKQAPGCC